MKVKCRRCGGVFWSLGKRRRRCCDECKDETSARSKQVWSKANYHLGDAGKKVLKLRPEVSALLGLTPAEIGSIEQRVFEKIRREHPELRELWEEWIRQGMPRPALSDGSELLDYQFGVAEWWETYERVLKAEVGTEPLTPALSPSEGERVSGSGPAKIPKAAAECLRQIEAFQRAVRRALDEFVGKGDGEVKYPGG